MFFSGSCLTGATMYGDWIPYAPSEIIFTCIMINVVRVYWGAIMTECCNYLSTLYEAKNIHNKNTMEIKKWMNQN